MQSLHFLHCKYNINAISKIICSNNNFKCHKIFASTKKFWVGFSCVLNCLEISTIKKINWIILEWLNFIKILIISASNLKLGPEWRVTKMVFTLSSPFLGGHGTAFFGDFFWWQVMSPGTSVPNALCLQWWWLKAPLLEVCFKKKKSAFLTPKGKLSLETPGYLTRVPQIIKWPTHLQKSEVIASSLKLSILVD